MKSFWQHENGMIYALRSNTFGKITGAAGPLDPYDLKGLDSYEYGPAILQWVERAIVARQLRRVNPSGDGLARTVNTVAP
jgi:hypothetical protein